MIKTCEKFSYSISNTHFILSPVLSIIEDLGNQIPLRYAFGPSRDFFEKHVVEFGLVRLWGLTLNWNSFVAFRLRSSDVWPANPPCLECFLLLIFAKYLGDMDPHWHHVYPYRLNRRYMLPNDLGRDRVLAIWLSLWWRKLSLIVVQWNIGGHVYAALPSSFWKLLPSFKACWYTKMLHQESITCVEVHANHISTHIRLGLREFLFEANTCLDILINRLNLKGSKVQYCECFLVSGNQGSDQCRVNDDWNFCFSKIYMWLDRRMRMRPNVLGELQTLAWRKQEELDGCYVKL